MKLSGLFGILIMTIILVISHAKSLSVENVDDLELIDHDTRSFLKKKHEKNYDKYTDDSSCVLCKFNMIPCCKPNLCIKKSFRPDECLKLKPRDLY
ncbi:unnamed protein product [Adineta steineri]|uniref:Uncharacterized protein n=1 Tax=Adineta steineri TaxID=433720 RepID=A0A813M9G7_9BILA|nr:unnamed protein product [Adineta steineri]CAF3988818.1 unnamed protein product [Adineta steineri]CAF4274719.1 unnamed protein product [Adineta steineri]